MVAANQANVKESANQFVDKSTGEIAPLDTRPDDAALASLGKLEDVFSTIGESLTDASDIGSGFALLEDKNRLVGVPCVFLFWTSHMGDYGMFVSAHVVTHDEDGTITGKFIVNDGSTGLAEQLGESGKLLRARHGLRKSTFPYCETCKTAVDKGEHAHKTIPAETFYIDTSA